MVLPVSGLTLAASPESVAAASGGQKIVCGAADRLTIRTFFVELAGGM
jgi:hypothetical protein